MSTEGNSGTGDRAWLIPTGAAGFSYPLIMSRSVGALLPMGKQDEYDIRPTEPAFRIEGEVGLGGGTVAAGFYIPAGGAFAVNIKVARLRTWLATWQEEKDTTFDGGMMELVTLGHVPGKLGLGYFEGEEAFTERRTSFTYAFMGVGL